LKNIILFDCERNVKQITHELQTGMYFMKSWLQTKIWKEETVSPIVVGIQSIIL